MIECKNGECIHEKKGCCLHCENVDCPDRCGMEPETCGKSSMKTETTDLTLFQTKAMETMRKIANLDLQMKQLEAQGKVVRQELQEAMDKYGVKKFENDILKITYVEPTTREAIDSKKLKADLPAVAAKYTKISQVKGFVKIEVK